MSEITEAQRVLGREILNSPSEAARFVSLYDGPGDALDALRRVTGSDPLDDPMAERPALERIIYARANSAQEQAAQRNAEARLRLLLDTAARQEDAVALALEAHSHPRPHELATRSTGSRPRRRIAIAATVGATAVVITGAVIFGILMNPRVDPSSSTASPRPTESVSPTGLPAPVDPAPTFDAKPDYGPLPPADRPLASPAGETVTEQFGLGTEGTLTLYGYGTDKGSVCIAVDNSSTPDTRTGYCVPFETFRTDGITIDLGGTEISWLPNGFIEIIS